MNQIRYAIVNRLLARPADPKDGAARRSRRSRSRRRATSRSHKARSRTPRPRSSRSSRRPVPSRRRFAWRPARRSTWMGACPTTPARRRSPERLSRRRYNWKASFLNATWFASRPIVTAALPPGSISPNSDQLRVAAGIDLSKAFRVDTQLNYDATQKLLLEDRSLADVSRVLLHDLRGAAAAAPAADAAARPPLRREPERHRDAARSASERGSAVRAVRGAGRESGVGSRLFDRINGENPSQPTPPDPRPLTPDPL